MRHRFLSLGMHQVANGSLAPVTPALEPQDFESRAKSRKSQSFNCQIAVPAGEGVLL